MSFEVYAITGRLFVGTITKVQDSTFSDGTEIKGIEARKHRLRVISGGMDLRDLDPEYTPLPAQRDSLTYELSLDIRAVDAAMLAVLMDEVDYSSGTGVMAQRAAPKTAEVPTRALIFRPLKHASAARYLYGPRWSKRMARSDVSLTWGGGEPHLDGTVLTLWATRSITTTGGVALPAAMWSTASTIATETGLSAGS